MQIKRILTVFQLSTTNNSSLRLPSFTHFALQPSLHQYLESENIHTPTFIQYALLSKIYAPPQQQVAKNYHIVSHTGSGKTLAYMLPIVDHLKKDQQKSGTVMTKSQRPRAIVFTSNKELVLQARNTGKALSHHCKIKCEGLSIGKSLNDEKEIIEKGVDILVTSIPRFYRMLQRNEVYLSYLEWIVIDQIDTIMESQQKNLELLFEKIIVPKTANFSDSSNIKLIMSSTTNPEILSSYLDSKFPAKKLEKLIDKKAHVNLENIKHEFIHCEQLDKHQPVLQQIKRSFKYGRKHAKGVEQIHKIMIFCNTVKGLHDLEYFLGAEGITKNLWTLHSQLNKLMRLTNYERFRDLPANQTGILLATDLGARGLHFPNLHYIINYDFPLSTCDYLQRAGRTGRGGDNGYVVSLYHNKHLPIINELRGASFKSPLKIKNSAYGFKNREQTKRPNKFAH